MKNTKYLLLLPVLLLGILLIPTQAQEPLPVIQSCSGSVAASCSGATIRRTPVRGFLSKTANRIQNRRLAPVRNTLLRVKSRVASRSCSG